jgi:hypothetical protein
MICMTQSLNLNIIYKNNLIICLEVIKLIFVYNYIFFNI